MAEHWGGGGEFWEWLSVRVGMQAPAGGGQSQGGLCSEVLWDQDLALLGEQEGFASLILNIQVSGLGFLSVFSFSGAIKFPKN